MVARLSEPSGGMEMLMRPSAPPKGAHVTFGYRRNKQGNWSLTDYGRAGAAVAQRILLRYSLGYETRAELARRYSMSERQVQAIISGERTHWFTDPIRSRLAENAIGNARLNRSPKGERTVEVRRALERLAARAWDMLIRPERYSCDDKYVVANDLYLLSGAWREDEP